LDRSSDQIVELSNAQCGFAYRASIFNTIEKNRYIVLSVTYALKPKGEPKIAYKDLQNIFGVIRPGLPQVREAVLKIRADKSMVIDSGDPNSRSAGSFFKNPVISKNKFPEIIKKAKQFGVSEVPHFPFGAETVKIPAAWLIEKSGFQKGFRKGKAGLSSRHTLALINADEATAQDILNLKAEIQNKVKEIFDIQLVPEPVFVGFD
jgi:UDP-N-acetylmuramate dehydrogenase